MALVEATNKSDFIKAEGGSKWGTATSTIFPGVFSDTVGAPTPVGTAYVASAYVKLITSLSGVTNINLLGIEYTAALGFVTQHALVITPTTAALTTQRHSVANTSIATTTQTRCVVQVQIASGATVNCTLRFGGMQMELGTAPTSLILPTAGTPAIRASTSFNNRFSPPST